jgi:hypothetical protein
MKNNIFLSLPREDVGRSGLEGKVASKMDKVSVSIANQYVS